MKRQKQVFSTGEIPHLWYHKTQYSARNQQHNLYFENETIFSYGSHFPIAKHVQSKNGKKSAILLTTRTYSVTTGGHISAVRSAIPEDVQIFRVMRPDNSPESQLPYYLSEIKSNLDSANSRKMETTRNSDVNSAKSLILECRAFCKFFGFKTPKFPKLPKIDTKKLGQQLQAICDRQTARDAARRAEWEAETARRKQEADNWNASGICKHEPRHDAHNYGDVHDCARMREEEEWMAKSADIIAAWRNGDTTAVLRNPWNLPVMLRIRTFGADESVQFAAAQVETSRGAKVPVSHALRGLRFVRNVVKTGQAYQRNGHTLHLGNYAIARVDVDGTLTAGCHVIPYSEIERIAPELERLAATPLPGAPKYSPCGLLIADILDFSEHIRNCRECGNKLNV